MDTRTGETRDLTDAEKQMEEVQLAQVLARTNEAPISGQVKDMVDVGREAMNRAERRALQRLRRKPRRVSDGG